MTKPEAARAAAPPKAATPLKPALASIKASCEYLGDVSRAKLYADVLPELDTILIGSRRFILVESMDRYIQQRRAAAPSAGQAGTPATVVPPQKPEAARPPAGDACRDTAIVLAKLHPDG